MSTEQMNNIYSGLNWAQEFAQDVYRHHNLYSEHIMRTVFDDWAERIAGWT